MKRTGSIAVLATTLMLGVVPITHAEARPIECLEGNRETSIGSASAPVKWTHQLEVHSVIAGEIWTRNVDLTFQNRFGAGIDGDWSTSGNANIIIAKGETKLGISLHASGEWTWSSTVTVSDDWKNTTGSPQRLVWYAGTRRATGTYSQRMCKLDGTWGAWTYGTWGSWNSNWSGLAQCSKKAWYKNNYGVNSPEYQAILQTSCG
jgi:hypothetical protein